MVRISFENGGIADKNGIDDKGDEVDGTDAGDTENKRHFLAISHFSTFWGKLEWVN